MEFNTGDSRYNRQNRINPPQFAPGQGPTPLGQGPSPLGQGPSPLGQGPLGGRPLGSNPGIGPLGQGNMNTPGSMNTPGGIPLGGRPLGGPSPLGGTAPLGGGGVTPIGSTFTGTPSLGLGLGMNNQPAQKSTEDKFWEAAGKAGKGAVTFSKGVTESFSGTDVTFWAVYGKHTMVLGAAVAVLGIVFKLFGLSFGLKVTIGSLLTAALGVVVFLFSTDKIAKGGTPEPTPEPMPEPTPVAPPIMNDFNDFNEEEEDFGDEDFEEEEEEDWGDFQDNSFSSEQVSEGMDIEDALDTAQTFEKGMYVRQYLFDMFTKVLPTITPGFAEKKVYSEDSDTFMDWVDNIQDAGIQAGCKEEEGMPELLKYEETLFTIQMTTDRPKGVKPEALAKEIGALYEEENNLPYSIAPSYKAVGSKIHIKLFTGKSAMVSLMDMYNAPGVTEYMKNEKNVMPVVFGINTEGEVIYEDMKKLESVLIQGEPRTGKSWIAQAILYQMCAFMPPTQLHIYIFDPKGNMGDFFRFTMPHVKKFGSTSEDLISTMRDLVYKEGARRKKIIGDAGHVNIWDYKEEYPDVKLPLIYLFVDEVMTFTSDMDKESKQEFNALMRMLVSQLPAAGVRVMLVPHLINNDVIEKKVTDLIPCRMTVKGNAETIEHVTGAKPREFPYVLANVGDIAIRLPNRREVTFIHGPVLTDDNTKNSKLFSYARRVWAMLEPEEDENCVAAQVEKGTMNKGDIQKIESALDDSDDVMFDNQQEDTSYASDEVMDDDVLRSIEESIDENTGLFD